MKKFLTIFFCQTFFFAPSSHAADGQAEHLSGKILSAYETVGGRATMPMGVAFDLEDGWYTYWKMPGDGGLPVAFDWSKSKNVADVKIAWPVPERIEAAGLMSFGYTRDFIVPMEVTPQKPGTTTTLDLTVNAVVCHDICIPQELHLTRTLAARGNAFSADKPALTAATDMLPATDDTDALRAETVVLGKDSVAVPVFAKGGVVDNVDLIVETPDSVLLARPEIIREGTDRTRAVLKVKAPDGIDLTKQLFGRKASVLIVNGSDALEKEFSF